MYIVLKRSIRSSTRPGLPKRQQHKHQQNGLVADNRLNANLTRVIEIEHIGVVPTTIIEHSIVVATALGSGSRSSLLTNARSPTTTTTAAAAATTNLPAL